MASNSQVIPPPPAGFVLEKSQDSRPTIPPPPPGFVLESSLPDASNPQPDNRSVGERFSDGFGSAAGETLINLGRLGSHIPGVKTASNLVGDVLGLPRLDPKVDPYDAVEQGTQVARQRATSTLAGKVGYGTENLAEFITGDEALKGLSYGDKLLHAARVAKMLEKSPKLLKAVQIGMNAMRQAAVGTAQGLAHGEDFKDAAEGGLAAGVTGGVLEGTIAGAKSLAPKLKEIAGELIPVRGSEGSKVAGLAENIADSKALRRFDVEETQPGAKRAISNIASDVEPASPVSNAAPLKPAADLGERATQIRAQVKPVFEKLDALTDDGRDLKFSDLQKQEKLAWRRGDFEAAVKARNAQEAILTEFKDQFDKTDLTNAKKAWAQASALDRVDASMSSKSVLKPTPVELRAEGVPDAGVINGKGLSTALLDLKNKGVLDAAGLSADHVQDLTDLASLLERSSNVKRVTSLLSPRNVALAETLGFALHPAAAIGAAKAAIPTWTLSKVLGQVATNPKVAKALVNVLRFAHETAPAVAAQMPSKRPQEIADESTRIVSNAVTK